MASRVMERAPDGKVYCVASFDTLTEGVMFHTTWVETGYANWVEHRRREHDAWVRLDTQTSNRLTEFLSGQKI